MSENYYCSSKLYIWLDDLDPSQVTELFGIEPDEAWRKNDERIINLPGGERQRLTSRHKRGCWYRDIGTDMRNTLGLEQQIDYWCQFLDARIWALKKLEAGGCEI